MSIMPAVVREFRQRDGTGERFDTCPLDAESVRVQAGVGEETHVLFVAVVAVDGVATGV